MHWLGIFVAFTLLTATDSQAQELEISGEVSLQPRWYSKSLTAPNERSSTQGLVFQPEFYAEISPEASINLTPFFRYDRNESQTTHTDLREAYVLMYGDTDENSWELRLGYDRTFWGVAELNNIVDIVNQVDLIDHPRDRPKLGQPMVHLTVFGDWGTAETFVLPYHRERSFSGRLIRSQLVRTVDENALYESGAEKRHVDFAFRYSHAVDLLDFGLSTFSGTSREPKLVLSNLPGTQPDDDTPLVPYYEQIRQYGIDAQLTTDNWLYKMEAIHRSGMSNNLGKKEDYSALVLGIERPVYEIFDSPADLNIITEWNYDSRGRRSTGLWQNDVYVYGFVTFNDFNNTEFGAGIVSDLDSNDRVWNMELKRRLTDRLTMRMEVLQKVFTGMEFTYDF